MFRKADANRSLACHNSHHNDDTNSSLRPCRMWRCVTRRRVFLAGALSLCALLALSLCLIDRQLAPRGWRRPQFLPNATRFRASSICAPTVLLLVNSAPQNIQRRQVIRETWGHPAVKRVLGLGVAFGVGEAAEDSVQLPLHWEAETFGDILQAPFLDSYVTLSRKILHLLKVARWACTPAPPFFIKVDDDVFVNPFALHRLIRDELQPESQAGAENRVWCLVWEGMPVLRSNRSKWAVSKQEFEASVYPTYCSGAAYIVPLRSLDPILKRHSESGRTPFPMEDVYVTGILALEAGIRHQQIGPRYAFESTDDENVASGKTVFVHLAKDIREHSEHLWKIMLAQRQGDVDEETKSDVKAMHQYYTTF